MKHAKPGLGPAYPKGSRCEHVYPDRSVCPYRAWYWLIRGDRQMLSCTRHLVRSIKILNMAGLPIKPDDLIIVKPRRGDGGF